MNIPKDLKYTESHEWVRSDGEIATVGITDHAQNELSDVVFIELPIVGDSCQEKGMVAVVESVKAASDIYCPISGEIVEINEALNENPSLVNTSPYESGWIFKVKMANATQWSALKDAEAYQQLLSA